ncbi:MAG: HD domain-containing protein [Acetatifactor sp.]|nr:HD domain-containing protein [Acetatifactor sp.]
MMGLRELIRILQSAATAADIDKYRTEIVTLIPKVTIMIGFDQQNIAHQYELWEHCLQTVAALPSNIGDDMLYLAALLHDIGKPDCQVWERRMDGLICITTDTLSEVWRLQEMRLFRNYLPKARRYRKTNSAGFYIMCAIMMTA